MRVIGSILLTLFLLIGTWGYTRFADSVRAKPPEVTVYFDDAIWEIEIRRTFDCVGDPDFDVPSFRVEFKGASIFETAEKVASSDPVIIGDLPEVEQGRNEIFVQANTDVDFVTHAPDHALRVQVRRGSEMIQDQTVWLPAGATLIQETIRFEAPRKKSDANDPNDEHAH